MAIDRNFLSLDKTTRLIAPKKTRNLEGNQNSEQGRNGSFPVSYTHLDVYKRQLHDSLAHLGADLVDA